MRDTEEPSGSARGAATAVRSGDGWAVAWIVVIVLAAALHAAGPLADGDLFWHLKLGELTLEARQLLHVEPLTFTIAPDAWVQHEWGGQLLLALAERAGGLPALRMLRAALVALFLGLLAFAFRRATGSATGAAAFVLLAWFGAEPNSGLRPHLFGWLFAAAVFALWWPTRPARRFAFELAALLAVSAVWANVHSSALLLPLVAAAALLDAALFGRRDEPLRAFARLLTAAAGIALTPAGFDLVGYALRTIPANAASDEWQQLLSLSSWAFRPLLVLTALLLVPALLWFTVAAWKNRLRDRADFPGPAVALVVLALALQHRRMAAFLFVPLLALLQTLVRNDPLRRATARSPVRPPLALLARAVILATTLVVASERGLHAWRAPHLRATDFPLAAAELMAEAGLNGRVLTPFEWAGYLSWRLHPAIRTFADGRWLEVGARQIDDGARLLLHRGDRSLYARYEIDSLVQPTRQFFASPPLSPEDWRLAWIDPVAIVLLRNGPALAAHRTLLCAFRASHPELAPRASWPALPGVNEQALVPLLDCTAPVD